MAFKEPEHLTFFDLTKDGGLLFFILAVTIGVGVDYVFDSSTNSKRTIESVIAFYFMPVIVMFGVTAAYMFIKFNAVDDNKQIFQAVNVGALALGLTYGFVGKIYLFYRAKQAESRSW